MVYSNLEMLERKTGHDARTWVGRANDAGMDSRETLKRWLNARGVTGYSAVAVEWEMFGYPTFLLHSPEELLDDQYADRQQLRPIVDKLLAWALAAEGIEIQLRKTYVSLQTAHRKFAQITPTNKTSVDLFLRIDVPGEYRLEKIRVRDDPFNRRLRLKTVSDIDASLIAALAHARNDSS
ncbi:DUF5655 domain-containing protein [Arthrobacter sp. Sr33]